MDVVKARIAEEALPDLRVMQHHNEYKRCECGQEVLLVAFCTA